MQSSVTLLIFPLSAVSSLKGKQIEITLSTTNVAGSNEIVAKLSDVRRSSMMRTAIVFLVKQEIFLVTPSNDVKQEI